MNIWTIPQEDRRYHAFDTKGMKDKSSKDLMQIAEKYYGSKYHQEYYKWIRGFHPFIIHGVDWSGELSASISGAGSVYIEENSNLIIHSGHLLFEGYPKLNPQENQKFSERKESI